MERMRNNPSSQIGEFKVCELRDYKKKVVHDLVTGNEAKTELPESNVLYYALEDDAWCCVRPSGTEPKIKFYMGVKESSMEKADSKLAELKEAMLKMCEQNGK